MKYVVSVVLLVVVSVGIYFGIGKFQEHQYIKSVSPFVKNSTLRLQSCIRYSSVKSGITDKELFKKIEESISETEKNILAVQTVEAENESNTSKLLVEYLTGVQEVQRALLSLYGALITSSSALERLEGLTKELEISYSSASNERMSAKALDEINKATEEGLEADRKLISAATKLKEKTMQISGFLPNGSVVDVAELDEYLNLKNKSNK